MLKRGIPTPEFYSFEESMLREIGAGRLLEHAAKAVGYPLVVKPNAQGSSFGVRLVKREDDLPRAVLSALSYDKRILFERYIEGVEVTVPVVSGKVFPPVEIQPYGEFFDFSAMYSAGETEYFVPARLEDSLLEQIKEVALQAAELFEAETLCRVDMIVERNTFIPYILELNTSPGMTATSLLPMSAEAMGMDFTHLVETIVVDSLKQKSKKSGKI
jgi:D-alanine-D-alanine ligase